MTFATQILSISSFNILNLFCIVLWICRDVSVCVCHICEGEEMQACCVLVRTLEGSKFCFFFRLESGLGYGSLQYVSECPHKGRENVCMRVTYIQPTLWLVFNSKVISPEPSLPLFFPLIICNWPIKPNHFHRPTPSTQWAHHTSPPPLNHNLTLGFSNLPNYIHIPSMASCCIRVSLFICERITEIFWHSGVVPGWNAWGKVGLNVKFLNFRISRFVSGFHRIKWIVMQHTVWPLRAFPPILPHS